MTRILACLLLLIVLAAGFGCQEQQKSPPAVKPDYRYFEMSYHGGWVGTFAFSTDSTMLFMGQQVYDTVRFGRMPDSLIQAINALLGQIKQDTIVSRQHDCYDCPSLAIKAAVDNDSISLFQSGNLDDQVLKLALRIDSFLESSRKRYFNGYIRLETARSVGPPPPPLIK